MHDQLTRRRMLAGTGALFAWPYLPKLARAEGRDPRLLTIVLRGGLDGLAAIAPVGDPNWVSMRESSALTLSSNPAALSLDGFFALHPAMPTMHQLFKAGEAIVVHAAATPYRERSHFDGQDVLESGLAGVGPIASGWLNRALGTLTSDGRASGQAGQVFAVGPVTPLVVRGPTPVLVWAPQRVAPANDDTLARLHALYERADIELAHVLEERMDLAKLLPSRGGQGAVISTEAAQRASKLRAFYADAIGGAAQILAHADGPRVGALALDGWDTHANEGIASGQLDTMLGALDGAIAVARQGLGDAWRETVIVIVTEFGRTVRVNGTNGTDHGTATVALLAGGALKGGRVIADWPGLRPEDLYENRDLRPTTDVRSVLKGLLFDHLRVDERALAKIVFPDSDGAAPLRGLV